MRDILNIKSTLNIHQVGIVTKHSNQTRRKDNNVKCGIVQQMNYTARNSKLLLKLCTYQEKHKNSGFCFDKEAPQNKLHSQTSSLQ